MIRDIDPSGSELKKDKKLNPLAATLIGWRTWMATALGLGAVFGGDLPLTLAQQNPPSSGGQRICNITITEVFVTAYRNEVGSPAFEKGDRVIGIPLERVYFMTAGRGSREAVMITAQVGDDNLLHEVINRRMDPSRKSFDINVPCDNEATKARGSEAITVEVKDQDNGDLNKHYVLNGARAKFYEMLRIDRAKISQTLKTDSNAAVPPDNAFPAVRIPGVSPTPGASPTPIPPPRSPDLSPTPIPRVTLTPYPNTPTPDSGYRTYNDRREVQNVDWTNGSTLEAPRYQILYFPGFISPSGVEMKPMRVPIF